MHALDDRVMEILTDRSQECFKKPLSKEQVRMCFKPTLTSTAPYNPTIKTKINIGDGEARLKVWSEIGKRIEIPKLLSKS